MRVKDETKEQLMNAMFNLVRAINKEAGDCGKTCGGFNEKEMIILMYLGSHNGVKMSDLAAIIDSPMSTVTSIVNKLVENGFLNRDHSAEDRRIINVFLSSTGKAAYKKIRVNKDERSQAILSGLAENEQTAMIKYINILASALVKN
jgi:DNA-binding MarR family transcriptional regulator